jgi:hypothetical protein
MTGIQWTSDQTWLISALLLISPSTRDKSFPHTSIRPNGLIEVHISFKTLCGALNGDTNGNLTEWDTDGMVATGNAWNKKGSKVTQIYAKSY